MSKTNVAALSFGQRPFRERRGERTGGLKELVGLGGDRLDGLARGNRLLLSSGDLSVVGLLVERDEEEEVRREESATEDGGTLGTSARSRRRPPGEVGRGEVCVGCSNAKLSVRVAVRIGMRVETHRQSRR